MSERGIGTSREQLLLPTCCRKLLPKNTISQTFQHTIIQRHLFSFYSLVSVAATTGYKTCICPERVLHL